MEELKNMTTTETMAYALKALLSGHNDPLTRIKQHVLRCSLEPKEKPRYCSLLLSIAKQHNLF
jgi:hypothetical protein